MEATISKWGNSLGLRISKKMLDELGISEGDKVDISQEGNQLVLKKALHRPTLDELFAGYEGYNDDPELDWGEPVGEEIW